MTEPIYENNLFRVFRDSHNGRPVVAIKAHREKWRPEEATAARSLAYRLFGAGPEGLLWSNENTGHPTVTILVEEKKP